MNKVDIKKLAEQLGLSPSTVSRSLRDSHEISAATKQRVKDLAEKLNYQPHPYASSLRRNKSKTIAVIVPEVANNFFSKVFDAIDLVAQENNYHVLIYLTHDDYNREVKLLHHLQSGRVDGVIMSLATNTKNFDHITQLKDTGVQIIFFDRIFDEIATTKITTNDFDCGFNAVEHLVKKGCRRIAHITSSLHLSTTQRRRDGYIAACKKFNLPIEESLVLECTTEEDAEKKLKKLLTSKQKPDGLFSALEKLSLVAYKVCEELNINIPKQLKYITFSNAEMAPLLHPSLTTITQPAFEIGKEAASILMKHLEKKNLPIENTSIVFPATIIERGSTSAK